jgi:hypothetical protein
MSIYENLDAVRHRVRAPWSKMSQARPKLLFAIAALAPLFHSTLAKAERSFPSALEQDVPLSYLVPCSVCHIKGNTGSSTAITAFALSLRARGLSEERSSIAAAMAQLATDRVDSDGDGKSDVDELVAGTDPNSSANGRLIGEQEPGYGCGGTAPTGSERGGQAAAVVGLGGWLLRRRRDRGRGRA